MLTVPSAFRSEKVERPVERPLPLPSRADTAPGTVAGREGAPVCRREDGTAGSAAVVKLPLLLLRLRLPLPAPRLRVCGLIAASAPRMASGLMSGAAPKVPPKRARLTGERIDMQPEAVAKAVGGAAAAARREEGRQLRGGDADAPPSRLEMLLPSLRTEQVELVVGRCVLRGRRASSEGLPEGGREGGRAGRREGGRERGQL
jgi:hypothetical protein